MAKKKTVKNDEIRGAFSSEDINTLTPPPDSRKTPQKSPVTILEDKKYIFLQGGPRCWCSRIMWKSATHWKCPEEGHDKYLA